MTGLIDKHRKLIFWLLLGLAFGMIYSYNLLTPYFSDDYAYAIEVRQVKSLWALVRQQYGEYLSNSGRVIGQFNVRLSLAAGKAVFNIINSLMFLALTLLMYANVRRKKKYDLLVLLLVITFLWRFGVSFGQTVLWLCGACNYLWGSVIILGFITFFRYFLEHSEKVKHPGLLAAGMFGLGIAAGWCNENTSGGGILLTLLFWFVYRKTIKKRKHSFLMLAGPAGMCLGFLGMLMAPGVRKRSAAMSEGEYSGLIGLISRVYKTTLTVRELFFVVLVILIGALVLLVLQKKLNTFHKLCTSETVLFLTAWFATAYALALAPVPEDRAFFGAGIFLFIACIQAIVDVEDQEILIKAARYGFTSILCLWLFFTYVDNLVNLARIYREEQERIDLILEERGDPNSDGRVVIPQFREAFANPYSNAHVSDLKDDKDYWINLFYEVYYDVGNITAIPRDEWNELYGEQRQ